MTRTTHPEQREAAEQGKRGRLTVFVAAAPGAGKTYAMLEEGHRRKQQGEDVVVGLVESYGRPRTEALSEGLEKVPLKIVPYKGVDVREMDVDGIIQRHPDVVLVDELYHTNAPGVKNEKRYQDVEEIRDAGIDVLSTMNIQHLESLKDLAEQISGNTVRETIPDRLLDDADEIQLVDISPEALRKRMMHGNIYPPQNIQRGLEGYFKAGNLAALRELALGWLANSEAERIPEETGAGENVVTAVREPVQSQPLIRRAVRMSRRYRGKCTVVTVLRPGEALSEAMEQSQALAEALNAHFEVITDPEPSHAIIEAVRRNEARQLVIGAPGAKFLERYRGNLVDELLDQLVDVDLHVIARLDPRGGSDGKTDPKAVVEAAVGQPVQDPVGTEGGDRGYLRIYVGYAPGCGTTSMMLREGQRRAGRGTKVVVGAAATYNLPANLEALEGLEVTPPRTRPRKPGGSGDMDLEAVMESGAQVVCVDDLGYENRADDAQFRYRYEEVEALRRAGFKVVSTLHLGDVASVAATVAAATGIPREGVVPDRVLREATELEVADVPPAVLLERLQQHDVPVTEARREELRKIYTLEVLSRLREIALRLALTHTDARLLAYMEATGITEQWESMARVMACVAPQPGLDPLIERSAREARRAEGKLVVVSVAPIEISDPAEQKEADAATARYQELTLNLGGQFVNLRSNKPAQALLDYARKTHVTEIVLARGDHREKSGPLGSSIKREIIRGASLIDVHVLRNVGLLVEQEAAAFTPEEVGH
ncbi:MAG: two-component system, OmpR family, sensor histidine kinase KdpD [Chloroflexota bacterium]|jgi:two-component system sensor histidine kinase KdpD|nr:two-component system, OmpR family, sensor histidine kinase KdpD [Chloroflexota bacterium]